MVMLLLIQRTISFDGRLTVLRISLAGWWLDRTC